MIQQFLQFITDWWRGYGSLLGSARSPKWSSVRRDYLKANSVCEVCGDEKVSVHHIEPFNQKPELELKLENLITLCDGLGTNRHHLEMGHLGSWKSWNNTVRQDAVYWQSKIKSRPL